MSSGTVGSEEMEDCKRKSRSNDVTELLFEIILKIQRDCIGDSTVDQVGILY
jgi:hypothetical protein